MCIILLFYSWTNTCSKFSAWPRIRPELRDLRSTKSCSKQFTGDLLQGNIFLFMNYECVNSVTDCHFSSLVLCYSSAPAAAADEKGVAAERPEPKHSARYVRGGHPASVRDVRVQRAGRCLFFVSESDFITTNDLVWVEATKMTTRGFKVQCRAEKCHRVNKWSYWWLMFLLVKETLGSLDYWGVRTHKWDGILLDLLAEKHKTPGQTHTCTHIHTKLHKDKARWSTLIKSISACSVSTVVFKLISSTDSLLNLSPPLPGPTFQ